MRTAAQKAQHAEYMREWRKTNPKAARAAGQRRDEAVRKDPKRLARKREWRNQYARDRRKNLPEEIRRNNRNSYIRTHFGLEPEEYDQLLAEQSSVCKICNQPQNSRRNKYLCVDHDHETGRIRGLLCDRCNRAIGLFGDSIELLSAAIEYLRT